ncbi:MAG: cupin domain-containing protein [Acidobacteria bacterium]|nr:MAG: cupin domain-containing protein [Acidobacteriota bacterium]
MKTSLTAEQLIQLLGLQPHPEGGYFRETYKSSVTVPESALPAGCAGCRSAGTAIYFLLRQGDKSHLHRLRFDEVWHFYLGGPLCLVVISPEGMAERFTLGQDLNAGQELQRVVPAGHWFGAYPLPGSAYSLVGCTVAPGFAYEDFRLGKRDELTACFPDLGELITELTQD